MFARRLILVVALLTASCDSRPPHASTPATAPVPIFQLELKPITPLLPNRPTHFAVDALGNVYWVQETDRGDDTMFVIGQGEIPRATQLSAGNIAAALGVANGRGNIHGIAAGPAGEIYFFFLGSSGRTVLAAFGQYVPRTAKIRIIADSPAIASATAMGRSLPLARGSVLSDQRYVWLWIRHTDSWSLFKLDPTKLPPAGPAPLPRAFDSVKLDNQQIDLTREQYDLSAGPDSNLFLLDAAKGRVLRIDPAGRASLVRSLTNFPSDISTPTVDRTGKMLLFADARSHPFPPSSADEAGANPPPPIAYPAMLMFDNEQMIAIESPQILAYPGYPISGMRLRHMIPNPSQSEWVTYDVGSGELLRLKIREKIPQ